MRKVKGPEKVSVEMKLVSMRARFERAMTQEYKALGEFPKAFNSFKSFDSVVDDLMGLDVPEKFKGELGLRKIHNKRQQAEMLRLSGRYAAALSLLKEALVEYPEWADEARRQTELHQADALRLLGNAEDALLIYERLETTAKNRQQDGLLAAVLWPMVGAIQTQKDLLVRQKKIKIALDNIMYLAGNDPNQNRYLFIYSRLISVAENVKNSELALDLVSQAIKAGPLEPDCFRTEYAHAKLCRAEIERAQGNIATARQSYHEALRYYALMEMRWGIVRSTIGLNLLGGHLGLPANLSI